VPSPPPPRSKAGRASVVNCPAARLANQSLYVVQFKGKQNPFCGTFLLPVRLRGTLYRIVSVIQHSVPWKFQQTTEHGIIQHILRSGDAA